MDSHYRVIKEKRSWPTRISTSQAKTASGKNASAKLSKIRAEMYFLLLLPALTRRLVILTEADMYDRCMQEVSEGRVPSEIRFALVELPPDLQEALSKAQKAASDEVTPR